MNRETRMTIDRLAERIQHTDNSREALELSRQMWRLMDQSLRENDPSGARQDLQASAKN